MKEEKGEVPLSLGVRVLHAPKEGNTADEYEDAFAVQPSSPSSLVSHPSSITVAVADGASSAVFAREWARLLVEEFAAAPPGEQDGEAGKRIARLGQTWRERVSNGATKKLPWYAQEKLPHGSSAALLVVTWDVAANTWSAQAVGDSCLFVVRKDRLHYAFPVTKSAGFNDRPALLSTEAHALPPSFVRFGASFEPGDRFLLMTDALAAWFLAEWEKRRRPWNDLPADETALAAWLKARRDAGTMKNDDVTLVEVTISASAGPAGR